MAKVSLHCENCEKEYSKKECLAEASKYCTRKCKDLAWRKEKSKCVDCSEELSKRSYERCRPCFYTNNAGENNPAWKGGDVSLDCNWCDTSFSRKRGEVRDQENMFCCRECEGNWNSKHRRGSNSHSWKGGVTKLRYAVRTCRKYKEWRTEIFKRDDYTCNECTTRGGRLEVHHIHPFSLLMEESKITSVEQAESHEQLWDTSNGVVLCKGCHDLITFNKKEYV